MKQILHAEFAYKTNRPNRIPSYVPASAQVA